MNCKSFQNELANQLFASTSSDISTNPAVAEHLAACSECSEEAASIRKTMILLNEWKAPEPSAYFDQKLAVMLREEQANPPASWLEKLRERLLFNTGRQFRPAMVGALALLLLIGGGTFAGLSGIGISGLQQPKQVQASAAVNDLQILDKNEVAIQQMDQLLQDDDSGDTGTDAQPAS